MGLKVIRVNAETRKLEDKQEYDLEQMSTIDQIEWALLNPGQIIVYNGVPSACLESSSNFTDSGEVDKTITIKPLTKQEIEEVERRQQMMMRQMQAATSGLALPGQPQGPISPEQAEILRRMNG